MVKLRLYLLLICLIFSANLLQGYILDGHFGVTPTLQSLSGGDGTHAFLWTSLVPTLHTNTATFVDCDWFGEKEGTTYRGNYPAGGELYDVEALYFDDDPWYFYLAIITSVPHKWGTGVDDVGIVDPTFVDLYTSNSLRVRPGDISLNLFEGTATTEPESSEWYYNYGIDICHEDRDNVTTYTDNSTFYHTCDMRDNNLGTALYKTSANADQSVDPISLDPADGDSDWHASTRGNGTVTAHGEHTNFDHLSESNVTDPAMLFLGDATDGIVIDYYDLTFVGGNKENGQDTYVIEATIPRTLFGEDNPSAGERIGFRFTPGCRNDGNTTQAVATLTHTTDEGPLPVTLSSFTGASLTNNFAQLNWVTQSESNNLGWNLYRSSENDPATSILVNPSIILGAGTSSTVTQYSYIDEDLPLFLAMYYVFPGEKVWYWLESNDLTGQTELFEPISITIQEENGQEIVPPINKEYGLYSNYPNPFNPNTTISFNLNRELADDTELVIFNLKGQLIRKYSADDMEVNSDAGYSLVWDGNDKSGAEVPSGIYLYILKDGDFSQVKKMILLK